MRKMKDSGIEWIGQIPEDWETTKIKHVVTPIKSGGTPDSDNDRFYAEEGIPWVAISDMSTSSYVFDTEKHITEEGRKSKNLLIFPTGTLLYSIYATVGKVSQLKIPACINQAILALIPHEDIYLTAFLKYNLKAIEDYVYSQSSGNTQFNLNAHKVNNFSIVLPNFETQKRIADFLDEKCGKIDRYIEKQQQVIEKLKAYKQSVITEAVTKGLNPDVPMKDSGIEWIGMIPEHWEVCKFGYLTTVKSNLVHPNEYKSYPQVSSENIEKGSGKLLECHTVDEVGIISDNHLFFKGQILYSKIRPALNKATIAPFDGLCSADIYPIETKECLKFVLYSILSESFLEQVRTITETRVKMPKINQNELSGIWVTKIPYDEQQAIATYLDSICESIDKAIASKEKIVRKVIEYKKSLIYEAVTGKLEV